MTLFAVVVVHGNIYELPYRLDLITDGRPTIDTDQPHRRSLCHFTFLVNRVESSAALTETLMTHAHHSSPAPASVPRTDPFFADSANDRVVRGPHHRRFLPPSQMFLIRMGLESYRRDHPGRPTFDASQGDGGASLGGIPHRELVEALDRFLPSVHATAYGTPQGDVRVRAAIFANYYRLSPDSGLTPDHVVLTDGGRDALSKWYQAIQILAGVSGDCLLTSAAPWISYGHGSYLAGLNLLCAPSTDGSFKITPEGVKASIKFASQEVYRVRALVITTPDNPTGTFYTQEEVVELIQEATDCGLSQILVDLMYQTVLDDDHVRYDIPAILAALSPEARRRVTFMDGLTKSAGASNVRHAHLLCGDLHMAKCLTAIASHTVLPNVLGEAAAFEVYGAEHPDQHPWIRRVVEPTTKSRALFRARMMGFDHRFVADQGYYGFVHVAPWLERRVPDHLMFRDARDRVIETIHDTNDLVAYLTARHGLAVVPGAPFHQPEFIRFSLANTPDYTGAAVVRFNEALHALE